jgi:hypothetical protein
LEPALTFDEALSSLLTMVGEQVDVHVLDGSDNPHLVATFGGRLQAGHSITGGDPGEGESIFVRLQAGEERASINLDRELYRNGMRHPDGSLTVRFGSVELMIGRRGANSA